MFYDHFSARSLLAKLGRKDQVTCVYMYVCVFACVRVCACVFFEDEDKSHIAPDLLGLNLHTVRVDLTMSAILCNM